jgi:hypothetical protein
LDLYTEAGWSCLRKRFPGQVHPEEVKSLAANLRFSDFSNFQKQEGTVFIPMDNKIWGCYQVFFGLV